MVPNCYSSTCIRALTRFFCNREVPKLILSDNGSQFISSEAQVFIAQKGITWKFNIAAAPWWGSLFEWFVHSIKRCLKKILKNLRFNYEQLITLLAHIQAVINNRPLIFMYEEPGEDVLNPHHLLCGRTINLESYNTPYDGTVSDEDYTNINRIHEQLQATLNHVAKRWQNESLVELREHQRCSAKSNYENEIYEGDVVLIHDARKPRAQWTIGVVDKINPSRDNNVRGVIVRYMKNGTIFSVSRPITKLYPTEYKKRKDEVIPNFIDEIR